MRRTAPGKTKGVSPKSGTVTYSIDKNLLPFYTSRAGTFALIELLDYMPLRGKYSLLLYEFLSKWRSAGQVYQTIEQLRAQLHRQARVGVG